MIKDRRGWDVRTLDGQLVCTVADLAEALGVTEEVAARWVRVNENRRQMPATLIADAHRHPLP